MTYSEAQLERLIRNAEIMGNHWDLQRWKDKLAKIRSEKTEDGDIHD